MLTPPLLARAVQLRVTWPLPEPAVSPVGAPGGAPWTGVDVMLTVDVAVFAGEELSVTVRVAVKVPALL